MDKSVAPAGYEAVAIRSKSILVGPSVPPSEL